MIRFKKNIRPEAKRTAKKIIDEYGITDTGGLAYIETFASAYSTELDAQDIIAKVGLLYKDRFKQVKANPACTVLRDARAQKMAALKALNLDLEPLQTVGRPGGK